MDITGAEAREVVATCVAMGHPADAARKAYDDLEAGVVRTDELGTLVRDLVSLMRNEEGDDVQMFAVRRA